MILFIDTSGFNKLVFAAIDHGKTRGKNILTKYHDSHRILTHLHQFLDKDKYFKKLGFSAISRIYVVSGPGSFTGIRAGISIALGIGFATGIHLFALSKDKVPADLANIPNAKAIRIDPGFEPEYGAEPNISKAR